MKYKKTIVGVIVAKLAFIGVIAFDFFTEESCSNKYVEENMKNEEDNSSEIETTRQGEYEGACSMASAIQQYKLLLKQDQIPSKKFNHENIKKFYDDFKVYLQEEAESAKTELLNIDQYNQDMKDADEQKSLERIKLINESETNEEWKKEKIKNYENKSYFAEARKDILERKIDRARLSLESLEKFQNENGKKKYKNEIDAYIGDGFSIGDTLELYGMESKELIARKGRVTISPNRKIKATMNRCVIGHRTALLTGKSPHYVTEAFNMKEPNLVFIHDPADGEVHIIDGKNIQFNQIVGPVGLAHQRNLILETYVSRNKTKDDDEYPSDTEYDLLPLPTDEGVDKAEENKPVIRSSRISARESKSRNKNQSKSPIFRK